LRIAVYVILATLTGIVGGCITGKKTSTAGRADYGFIFLGDLHFDRPGHHDMDWVCSNYPGDVVQIQDYCRITEEHTPGLFGAISGTIKERPHPVFAVVQAGDFVEGLCGSYELQRIQFEEAKTFAEGYFKTVPFLISMGNHDITGPAAQEAYRDVILPWIGGQLGRAVTQASYAVRRSNDLFIFFDAIRPDLDWLEETLRNSNARHTFFVTHKPVVPFDARANWHLFAEEGAAAQRERLLELLGRHRAIVLCGHLHAYSLLSRKTAGGGFVQLAANSVVRQKEGAIEKYFVSKDAYGADLVSLEPSFSPVTLEVRKHNLETEKPEIGFFEYARTAGWCFIQCCPDKVVVEVYPGCSQTPWRVYDISLFGGNYTIEKAKPDAGRRHQREDTGMPEITVEVEAGIGSFPGHK